VRRCSGRKRTLAMPERMGSRRVAIGVEPRVSPPDALTDERCFRVLIVVDDFTRACLTFVSDTSLGGHRVAHELDAIIAARGQLVASVSDNGTELTALDGAR